MQNHPPQVHGAPTERATSSAPPLELSSFIGRDREVAELARLLGSTRLLTLTGAGGSGKTRLALELITRRASPAGDETSAPIGAGGDSIIASGDSIVASDDSIVTSDDSIIAWVELAAVEDAAKIPQHILSACGIGEELPAEPGALVSLLRDRSILLVLDNCEHVVDECAAIADSLLRGCPDMRILATSREALGVRGERAWLVPALSVPDTATIEAALSSDAVRLFIERATESAGAFAITPQNVDAIVEICRRLDGIPLALELAAARVRHLGVEQVRERLGDAFSLLRSGARTTIPRHRTIAATLDWSHDLLPADERALFRRISVFRGGFTLDAVESIGAGAAFANSDVLDLLARLVDRSLVGVREQGGAARYSLLETVLQYARRRLDESGEEHEVRRLHASHVVDVVAEAEPHLIRPERRHWVDRLLPDIENIRDALAWTYDNEPGLHVRLAGMLWWFWFSTRHWTEARVVIESALLLPAADAPGLDRAKLLFAGGALAALQSRNEAAHPLLEEAALIAATRGDRQLEAYALNYRGMVLAGEGRREAWDLCVPAAAWFEANGDMYGLRLAKLLLGTSAMGAGDMDEAELQTLEGVRIARSYRQDRELAIALQTAAIVFLRRNELDRAEAMLLESIDASRRDPAYFAIGLALETLGELWCRRGRLIEGARLLGAGEATRDRIGAAPFRFNAQRLADAKPGFRDAAGGAAFDRAWSEGMQLTPEAAMDEALALGQSTTADTVSPTSDVTVAGAVADAGAGGASDASADAATPADRAASQLFVRALGRFDVQVDGESLPEQTWSYSKPKELLVFLLLHPAGAARDTIARALWPASAPAQAKNSFHVTLHNLRKALGHPEWITLDRDVYRLAADLDYGFDADLFDRDARVLTGAAVPDTDSIQRVLALYRGDLLEHEVAGPWHEDYRATLRRRFIELQLLLGAALEDAGRHSAAAEVYHAITVLDDLQEEAHRRLMTCWARSGDRVRALRHYDRLRALIRDVLDAEPDDETIVVAQQIRDGGPGPSPRNVDLTRAPT